MAQGGVFVTLGELLEVSADTERENLILERLKLLAQEHLPEGWADWKVIRATKEEVFGDSLDPQLLNKLRFALPTVGLARAFDPDIEHLSEKGFRELKIKLLDWEFTRALIISPPAVSNRIRGSAVQTEIFNKALNPLKHLLLSRSQADAILSGEIDSGDDRARRRRSNSSSLSSQPKPKKSKVDVLEKRMEDMFAVLMDKIESLKTPDPREAELSDNYSVGESELSGSAVSDNESLTADAAWRAPRLDSDLVSQNPCDDGELSTKEFEFLPQVREAEPLVPEPSPQIKKEGIECQRLGTEGWNRIRYKEVEKSLHAAPVFSALKINTELGGQVSHASHLFAKQDGMLGTITHGLLLQRKALAEDLKRIARNCPAAAEEVRKVLAENSPFRSVTDNLLQFVCAHRAEMIDFRRRAFRPRNDILNLSLHQIPPSATHLFEEKALSVFLKDNGGIMRIFPSKFGRFPDKRDGEKDLFRRPSTSSRVASSKSKQPTWRTRSSAPMQTNSANGSRATFRKSTATNLRARQQSSGNQASKRGDNRQQRGRKY